MTDEQRPEIEEEYKIWKKNTPFLYDILLTKCLEWPSLTFQWNKSIHNVGESYQKQQIVLGTQTSDQDSNSLIFANVKLPNMTCFNGEYNKIEKKIDIETIIDHDGDVNKARINPFHENLLGSKSSNGNVYIYDKYLHPSKPLLDGKKIGPQMVLEGHSSEGYGLGWSKFESNILISGSNDKRICVWDINSSFSKVNPLITYDDHTGIVEDIVTSPENSNVFYSASDDFTIKIFDLREKSHVSSIKAHENNVNSIDINQINKVLLLSASSDHTIALWDIRNLSMKNYIFDFHSEDVLQVKWNYKHESIFASGSADRRIIIWDLSKIGNPLSVSDSEDGPPELMFIHSGHMSSICDFDWNSVEGREMMIGSVESENNVHVFEVTSEVMSQVNDDQVKIR